MAPFHGGTQEAGSKMVSPMESPGSGSPPSLPPVATKGPAQPGADVCSVVWCPRTPKNARLCYMKKTPREVGLRGKPGLPEFIRITICQISICPAQIVSVPKG